MGTVKNQVAARPRQSRVGRRASSRAAVDSSPDYQHPVKSDLRALTRELPKSAITTLQTRFAQNLPAPYVHAVIREQAPQMDEADAILLSSILMNEGAQDQALDLMQNYMMKVYSNERLDSEAAHQSRKAMKVAVSLMITMGLGVGLGYGFFGTGLAALIGGVLGFAIPGYLLTGIQAFSGSDSVERSDGAKLITHPDVHTQLAVTRTQQGLSSIYKSQRLKTQLLAIIKTALLKKYHDSSFNDFLNDCDPIYYLPEVVGVYAEQVDDMLRSIQEEKDILTGNSRLAERFVEKIESLGTQIQGLEKIRDDLIQTLEDLEAMRELAQNQYHRQALVGDQSQDWSEIIEQTTELLKTAQAALSADHEVDELGRSL